MTRKIQLKLDFRQDLEKVLQQKYPGLRDYRILTQSLDARGASRGRPPTYHYTVEILGEGENFQAFNESFPHLGPLPHRPIIIGAGPAGLFCALRLAEYGVPSLIFERGESAHQRMLQIARFWRYGELNPESNVCYGEGGAGLFSDGKLMTRIKSPHVPYVMKRLVDFGAPPETAYFADPHLGSNKIRKLIGKISSFLKEKGCEIFYNTRVDSLLFEKKKVEGVRLKSGEKYYSPHVILATGHSAKEMYHHLSENQVQMRPKSFALGVRIEHMRKYIDSLQYGPFAGEERLGTARYRLSYEDKATARGTYSFCMCPGGYILSSGTDEDGLVVNGMSNYARNSPWSNAALVVSVTAGKDFALTPPVTTTTEVNPLVLEGLEFQASVEKKAFDFSRQLATGREIPALTVKEFLEGKVNYKKGLPVTSCPSGVVKAPLDKILPAFVHQHLQKALEKFEQSFPGYRQENAILLAPESRTSAPVTILRDPMTLESVSHEGLYPCGEGAGYAGGITSSAVDGVKVALGLLNKAKGLELPSEVEAAGKLEFTRSK